MARLRLFDPALLRVHLQASGPTTAQALASSLNAHRLTVQRALSELGDAVVRLGTTRGTRYALRRSVMGKAEPCVISRLTTPAGVAHEWCTLTALHGGWHLQWASPTSQPAWADRVHDHTGYCEGVPFFLADLRPQGFLGRAIAGRLSRSFGLPTDPRDWSDDQTLFYLRTWGHDLPGNLAIDPEATSAAVNFIHLDPVTAETRGERYPRLATQASAGETEPYGSSVEGEQPKFTTWVRQSDGNTMAVLVKFTDQLETPTGRRWADLLAAEAIAVELLASPSGTSNPTIFDFDGRRFYEFPRFDRVGLHGRRGVVTLRALHDAGFTQRDTNTWAIATAGLHQNGWLSAEDLQTVRLRQLFGNLIGNTDMHFGNLAFFLDLDLPVQLAPAYDMLPALWAPRPGDATPAPNFAPPAPLPNELDLWPQAAALAQQFWNRVEADPRVSDGFRPHASNALRALQTLRTRFG